MVQTVDIYLSFSVQVYNIHYRTYTERNGDWTPFISTQIMENSGNEVFRCLARLSNQKKEDSNSNPTFCGEREKEDVSYLKVCARGRGKEMMCSRSNFTV